MTKYGENLYRLRKEKRVSQEETARNVGLTKSTISKYERGEILPTLDVAKDIAEYFGVTVDSMVGNENEKLEECITERNFRELVGLPKAYIRAIKLAFNSDISPEELISLVNAASNIRNRTVIK